MNLNQFKGIVFRNCFFVSTSSSILFICIFHQWPAGGGGCYIQPLIFHLNNTFVIPVGFFTEFYNSVIYSPSHMNRGMAALGIWGSTSSPHKGDLVKSLFLLWGAPFMTGGGPKIVHYCTLSLSDLWVTRQECKVGTPYMRV